MKDSFEHHRVDVRDPHADAHVVSALTEHGAVIIEGLGDPGALLILADNIGAVVPHRDSAANGITTITDMGIDVASLGGFTGFTSRGLDLHTDRAGLAHPPELLLMVCGQVAVSGGECLLADGQAVYDYLAAEIPDALRALSAPRCALFGGAAGHLGSVFTTSTCGGRILVRLRTDELARFAPAATRWLPALRAAIDRHTTAVKLDRSQGYVLHNHRWLHGRRAFTGRRVMFRVHANARPHLKIPSGFRPAITTQAA